MHGPGISAQEASGELCIVAEGVPSGFWNDTLLGRSICLSGNLLDGGLIF